MALIDEFRRAKGAPYRGGYLWVMLCCCGFAVLAAWFPPGSGLTSWQELWRRLALGLPFMALLMALSVDPVQLWLRSNWSFRTSGAIFSVLGPIATLLYHRWINGAWPGVTAMVLSYVLLVIPFCFLPFIKRCWGKVAAGLLGLLYFAIPLYFLQQKMVLIRPYGDKRLDVDLWFILCIACVMLVFEYQLEFRILHTWKMRGTDGLWVLAGAVVLSLIVVLPAYLFGFSNLVLRHRSLLGIVVAFFAKTYFVALSQEYAFRGVGMEALPQSGPRWTGTRGTWMVLGITSLFFGLTHFPIGGFQYVVLATLAGLVYGWLYLKTERLAPSMILHGLLDTAKFLFFG